MSHIINDLYFEDKAYRQDVKKKKEMIFKLTNPQRKQEEWNKLYPPQNTDNEWQLAGVIF